MKTSPKRIALLLIATTVTLLGGTGCNTVRGVGRDVEAAGDGIQKSTR
jgi:predicted small secreted protein